MPHTGMVFQVGSLGSQGAGGAKVALTVQMLLDAAALQGLTLST